MDIRKKRSLVRSACGAAIAALAILALAVSATAGTSVSVTSVAPGSIKRDSSNVAIFGVSLTTDAADQLTAASITLNKISNFTTGDLAGASGVSLWRDNGATDDVLDATDTAVSTGASYAGDCSTVPTCTANLTVPATTLPGAAEGDYTYLIAVKTSNTISNGDTFTAAVTASSFTTTPAVTTVAVPVSTANIVADTVAPATPTVSALGLSKAAGKVRVGGTAVSTENPGVLEAWRDTDTACLGGSKSQVSESASMNLGVTNTDLIGTNDTQTTALQSFPAGQTVCYRVRDAAGNVSSPYVADGTVPAVPSTADTALLGVSNVTNLKKIIAQPDAAPGRTFRLYLRPGGAGLERAKDQNLVTPTAVEVTTGAGVVQSSSTDIRQWTNSTSLAAADGVAYSRVNANGNDSAVTDDGTIPAVPAAEELALLSTSAADSHQRTLADPDALPGRVYGLYLDPAGLTAWQRAVTTSGGSTPVRVTTASTSASSGTTTVFAGASQLTNGFAAGFVRVDGNGNESAVAANGTIPAAPAAANISYSDALNQFTVNPFTPGVEVGAYAGTDAASAYDGTPEGIATSSSPASVGELASGANLFYSAVNTSNGNESPLTADGSVPGVPAGADLTLLSTSAADGHKRLIAAADDVAPGRLFRLYVDVAGGSSYVRASTLSGGSIPVEVTTDGNGSSSTGGSVFAGTTDLAGGHAVGYAIVVGGNDSDVAADGTIPAAVAPATTGVSDALNNFVASGATGALPVNLHLGGAGDAASVAYSENLNGSANPDGTATSSAPVSIADPAPNSTVYYTVTHAATGNESAIVGDGTILGSPGGDLALLGVSAAQGHQRITSGSDGSAPRTFRLYVDPAGGSSYVRASTTSGGSTPVEVVTASGTASSATTEVYAGTTQLTSGHAIGHSIVSVDGNDSDVAGDQTIPAAPNAGNSFATAAIDEVTSTDASATNNIAVYRSTSSVPATGYDGTADATLDADQTKPLNTSAGDFLYYTRINTASGHESPITADGSIPVAPDQAASSASARTDKITVPDATTTNNVLIYLDANSTPATAYANGADYTTNSSPAQGVNLPAEYLYYVTKNTVSGNESAITSDDNIPSAPTGVDGAMTASAAEQRITSTNDSDVRTVRLYGDPAGGTDYVVATTTAGGSTPVEITTSTSGSIVSPQGVFLSGSPLNSGASLAYGRIFAGNESELVADGSIPSAPSGVGNFSADATDGTATIASAAATGTYRAFRGSTAASDRVDHTSGTPTVITVTGLAGGDVPGYALTVAGNESPVLADGTIPNAPSIALQAASDSGRSQADGITNDTTPTFTVTTTAGTATTLLEGATVHDTGTADGSGSSVLTADPLAGGAHNLTAKVTVGGNASPSSPVSAVTVDIAAPATPGAPDLLAASDTGSSSTDNLTLDATPSFGATVEANADALLFAGASQVANTIADGSGAATLGSSTLGDGTHAFTVKAVDAAGNTSAASSALNVEIDTGLPATPGAPDLADASDTGRLVNDGVTSDATPALNVTGTDAGATVTLLEGAIELATATADGSGNALLTSSVLTDGSHDLTVSVADGAGNVSATSGVTTVAVDTAAPAVPSVPALATDTGRSPTDGITNDATPGYAVQTEPVAIVELVKTGVAVGSATADGSGVAGPAVTSALLDGTHSLTARAIDVAGNVSAESAGASVTIDTAAPATPGAPDLSDASDTGSSFIDNVTADTTPALGASVEPDATAQLFAGASQVASSVADGSGAATLTSVELSDGTYGFAVSAVDVAGNASAVSSALSVDIDTVAPASPPAAALQAASDSGRSAVDGITSVTTPSFDVTGAAAGAQLELRESATTLASATADGSGNATLASSALSEGVHSLAVVALDEAGNVSVPSSATDVRVDTTAPAAPGVPSLASDTGRSLTDGITSNATPAFSVTTEVLANVDLVESGSSIGSAIADGAGLSAPVVGSALTDGVHAVTAKATDEAGNVSVESSATSVTVDTVAPSAPSSIDLKPESDGGSSATDDITNVNTPAFTVSFAEAGGLVKLYDDTAVQSATAIGDTSVPITADVLADGAHSMKATVSDVAGNESLPTTALGVTVDTLAPATPAAPDLDASSDTGTNTDNITGDTTPTFTLAGGEAGSTLTLLEGATQRGTGDVASNGSASVTSDGVTDGLHTFTWKATDVAGNASASSSSLGVTIDTGVPGVVLTTTTSLTGQFKAVFSEHVTPVNNSNVVLRVNGTSVNVPASVTYVAGTKTATLKTNAPLVAGQAYTFIVGPPGSTKPADGAGAQVATTQASPGRASLIEQESSAGAKQLWAVVASSSASGGSYTTERLNGATASFSFSGTSVTWYTLLGPDQGKARVLIDGVSKGDFDNYRSAAWFKFPRTFSGLSSGSHTIKVVALGTRNTLSRNTAVAVDAFKAGSTTYEHGSFSFLWQSVTASPSSAGRYIRSDVAGTVVNFTFRGTGLDWMTVTGPNMGKAVVTIDGVTVGTVDNFSSSFRYGVLRSYRGLSDRVHTVRIVVLGTRSAASTGAFVAVDKFTVI